MSSISTPPSFAAAYMNNHAAPPAEGYPASVGVQTNLPVLRNRRALTPDEIQAVNQNLEHNWIGKLFPSYGTELHEFMANPAKNASLWGHLAGGVSSVIGGIIGTMNDTGHQLFHGHGLAGAAIGAAIGLPAAALAYFSQQQSNENHVEMMRRLPKPVDGMPTYRDLLSDSLAARDMARSVNVGADVVSTAANAAVRVGTAAAVGSVAGRFNVRPAVLV